ncbi:hypothetical protein [Nocardioides marmorisolisilvae]|uniref:Uncharacterized protein n=1 Tax=Nocardioides marmorisolisilvae TaxID=1542737 RepID=A0A3N0DWY1_9ACTN|nr:hypothetical protein [Nocardioides marmorisolisilvae]RNL80128.1 hypothetical protein EFL95_14555 [Nocardioides marmorisolisilvae]
MYARLVAAAAVTVSALLHLKMWFDGVRHENVGPPFLLNAIGGIAIAVLLLTWQHWVPPLLAVGFGISTIGAFTIAATVGLFGDHEQWAGGYVWTAAASEAIAIVAGGLALVASIVPSDQHHSPRVEQPVR